MREGTADNGIFGDAGCRHIWTAMGIWRNGVREKLQGLRAQKSCGACPGILACRDEAESLSIITAE